VFTLSFGTPISGNLTLNNMMGFFLKKIIIDFSLHIYFIETVVRSKNTEDNHRKL
jgi:hypothetical protein